MMEEQTKNFNICKWSSSPHQFKGVGLKSICWGAYIYVQSCNRADIILR